MTVITWIVEGTWPACVDAARRIAPADADIVLLHVTGDEAAAGRLGRPCTTDERHGRAEREVVAAAEGAGLLILARDGDDTRLGPKSLGPASRFVVDHAPCPVLLVWPREAPPAGSLPPPPPPRHPRHR